MCVCYSIYDWRRYYYVFIVDKSINAIWCYEGLCVPTVTLYIHPSLSLYIILNVSYHTRKFYITLSRHFFFFVVVVFFYLILFINSDLFHKQILLVNDVVVYKYIIIMNKIRKISLVYVARLLHNPKIIMVTCTYVRTIVLYHFIPVSKHAPTCVWMFHLVDWLYKNRYYNQMYDFCLCRIIYHNDTCIRCVAVIKWTTINSTQHMLYFV